LSGLDMIFCSRTFDPRWMARKCTWRRETRPAMKFSYNNVCLSTWCVACMDVIQRLCLIPQSLEYYSTIVSDTTYTTLSDTSTSAWPRIYPRGTMYRVQ
jgi:hypothetical protein